MPQPLRVAILFSHLIVNGVFLTFTLSLAENLANGQPIARKVGNGISELSVFTLQSVAFTAQAVVRVLKSEIFDLEPINKFFEIFFHFIAVLSQSGAVGADFSPPTSLIFFILFFLFFLIFNH